MAQINLQKVSTANNAPVGKLGIFVTPDNEAFLIDENGAVFAFGGGATTFNALTDTPASYTGQGLKAVRVNAAGTGLEFSDFPAGFDGNPSSLNQEGATNGQAIVWNNTAGEWQPATVSGSGGYDALGIGLSEDGDGNPQLGGSAGVTLDYLPDATFPSSYFEISFKNTLSAYYSLFYNLAEDNDDFTEGVGQFYTESGNDDWSTRLNSIAQNGVATIEAFISDKNDGGKRQGIVSSSNLGIEIIDEINEIGVVNKGDYEANFTARSLVTKQYVDGHFNESELRENNAVLFDKNYIIGNAGFRTGNITFDFTGAKLGATTVMRHKDAGAFTIPSNAELLAGEYDGTVDNYLWFVLRDKTASSEKVQYTISKVQP
jgi:hypothetical protein